MVIYFFRFDNKRLVGRQTKRLRTVDINIAKHLSNDYSTKQNKLILGKEYIPYSNKREDPIRSVGNVKSENGFMSLYI